MPVGDVPPGLPLASPYSESESDKRLGRRGRGGARVAIASSCRVACFTTASNSAFMATRLARVSASCSSRATTRSRRLASDSCCGAPVAPWRVCVPSSAGRSGDSSRARFLPFPCPLAAMDAVLLLAEQAISSKMLAKRANSSSYMSAGPPVGDSPRSRISTRSAGCAGDKLWRCDIRPRYLGRERSARTPES
jgi:hypothetical protein